MAFWVPTCGISGAFESWLVKEEQRVSAYVMPDLESFRDNTGVMIEGRRAWRDHLKRIGGVELSHSDLKTATERHNARKAAEEARLKAFPKVSVDPGQAKPLPSPQITARVLERLHGRPTPDRKTLIKIAIEETERRR